MIRQAGWRHIFVAKIVGCFISTFVSKVGIEVVRGIKEIQWLCFVYFPSIRAAVTQMANNRKG